MPLQDWTRGIHNAAAAFAGGDAIEANARTAEEARVLQLANQRALLDNRLTQSKRMTQELAARTQLAQTMTPEEANILLGGVGSDYAALRQGQLREQEGKFHTGAYEAFLAGDTNRANANLFGLADSPVAVTAVQGDTVIPDRFRVATGDPLDTTAVGASKIAANNALSAQRQSAAAWNAAREKQVEPVARAKIGAEQALARSRDRGPQPRGKTYQAVRAAGEIFSDVLRASDAAAGRSPLPSGESQTARAQADAAREAAGRAAEKTGSHEAFNVPQPEIEPTVPTKPIDAATVGELMARERPAPKGKGKRGGDPRTVPAGAIAALKADPSLAAQFEAKYGVPAGPYLRP